MTSLTLGSLADDALAAPAAPAVQSQIGATLDDFFVPGTQPNELVDPIYDSSNCAPCHGSFDPIVEPLRPWAASMMGQAGRDPIFYAALTIANQDVDFGGESCLRCHAPAAWLAGRSTPSNGSGLDPLLGDLDGVTCHFCHRMVDPISDVENPDEDPRILAALSSPPLEAPHTGSYIIDPVDRRRGPFDLGSFFYHEWRLSPFHRESLLCATCHDVSNPLLERQTNGSWQLGPLGQAHPTAEKQDMFPLERTFSEWAASVYAQAEIETGGRFGGDRPAVSSCQDCHMPDNFGTGCIPALNPPVRPDVPEHSFSGSNSWVLEAIRAQYPDIETGLDATLVADAIQRNEEMLQAASDLEVTVAGSDLRVRVTNMMGHKLPSGYGEGRRMWIDVRYFDAQGVLFDRRGGYDLLTATLDEATTVVYELEQGLDAQMSAATGVPIGTSNHFLLNNTVEKDNRIPARGFRSQVYAAIGSEVVGAVYEEAQYWSETLYTVPVGAVTAEVRTFHQTTSKEYAEFLMNENVTDSRGAEAYQLWQMFGMSRPVEMGFVTVDLATVPELLPRPLDLPKLTSFGNRTELALVGSTSASGAGAALSVTGGTPNALAVVFVSPVQVSVDFYGGVQNIGVGAYRLATLTLDANGYALIPLAYGPAAVGQQFVYQVMFRDAADIYGLGLTNGLRVDVTQ